MVTKKTTIREWFEEGNEATHLIVVCDTLDYEDYPVYVDISENVHELVDFYNTQPMSKVMEVYNLSLPMEQQLSEGRAFNY